MMNFLRKRILSFYYALQGIQAFFRSQPNMYIHALAAATAIGCGVYFNIARQEWMMVIISIFLVLAVEMINSAIEVLVDMVSPTWSAKAKYIKDVSAAAVLMVALGSALTGGLVFLPYFLKFFDMQ
jgi:diacylglycerol kinase